MSKEINFGVLDMGEVESVSLWLLFFFKIGSEVAVEIKEIT